MQQLGLFSTAQDRKPAGAPVRVERMVMPRRRWVVLDLVDSVYLNRGDKFTRDPNKARVFSNQIEAATAATQAREKEYRAVRLVEIPGA